MSSKSATIEELLCLVPEERRGEAERLLQQLTAPAAEAVARPDEQALRVGIKEIADCIVVAKHEVFQLELPDSARSKMNEASDELDEIVRSTEEATHQILNAAETIEQAAAAASEAGGPAQAEIDKIREEYMNIILACSFQDITGQRIKKVISALHFIEDKVEELMEVLGISSAPELSRERRRSVPRDDEPLLNGPPAPGSAAIDQSDIDSLFD